MKPAKIQTVQLTDSELQTFDNGQIFVFQFPAYL